MTTPEIQQEIQLLKNPNFRLGEYIYMAMGLVNNKRVCMATTYKIDYCIKKALEFQEAAPNVRFTHINKVKVGELERCKKISWSETSFPGSHKI